MDTIQDKVASTKQTIDNELGKDRPIPNPDGVIDNDEIQRIIDKINEDKPPLKKLIIPEGEIWQTRNSVFLTQFDEIEIAGALIQTHDPLGNGIFMSADKITVTGLIVSASGQDASGHASGLIGTSIVSIGNDATSGSPITLNTYQLSTSIDSCIKTGDGGSVANEIMDCFGFDVNFDRFTATGGSAGKGGDLLTSFKEGELLSNIQLGNGGNGGGLTVAGLQNQVKTTVNGGTAGASGFTLDQITNSIMLGLNVDKTTGIGGNGGRATLLPNKACQDPTVIEPESILGILDDLPIDLENDSGDCNQDLSGSDGQPGSDGTSGTWFGVDGENGGNGGDALETEVKAQPSQTANGADGEDGQNSGGNGEDATVTGLCGHGGASGGRGGDGGRGDGGSAGNAEDGDGGNGGDPTRGLTGGHSEANAGDGGDTVYGKAGDAGQSSATGGTGGDSGHGGDGGDGRYGGMGSTVNFRYGGGGGGAAASSAYGGSSALGEDGKDTVYQASFGSNGSPGGPGSYGQNY